MARKSRAPGKVDLRMAYNSGGYTGSYAWFVRNKVIPIIGEAALHDAPCKKGSRVKEYRVTKRNLQRVFKSLGIEDSSLKRLSSIEKAVKKASPGTTAAIILDLLENTTQPSEDPDFPINIKIPLHPLSHNMMYICRRGKFVRSTRYIKWARKFHALIQSVLPKVPSGFKVGKRTELRLTFGHVEKTDSGYFDMQNFAKSVIDTTYEHIGGTDHLIEDIRIKRELVEDYNDGYMIIQLRNI